MIRACVIQRTYAQTQQGYWRFLEWDGKVLFWDEVGTLGDGTA